jgi:hypothetical protein
MKIEIVVDPARPAPAQSLVSRVAPPPATVAVTTTTTRAARLVYTLTRLFIYLFGTTGLLRVVSAGQEVVLGKVLNVRRRVLLILMLIWRYVRNAFQVAMKHPDQVVGLHCKQCGCSCSCSRCSLSPMLFRNFMQLLSLACCL